MPEDGAAAFPAHLAPLWGKLQPPMRGLIEGPWQNDAGNTFVDKAKAITLALRGQGWPLAHIVDLARHYPAGLGALGRDCLAIIDAWQQEDLVAARREAERQERALFLKRISATTLLHRTFPPEEHLLGSIVTRTTRTFLVGSTGAGKTNLGLALAGGMASGQGFGRWQSCRPARVLYIDGEMSLPLLQKRVADVARRLGGEEAFGDLLQYVSWQEAADLLPVTPECCWAPLNTPEGQAFILKICDLARPDVVMFDNVQALLAGDMKDEIPWNETQPLAAALTARNIGQVWFDHTGHNTGRQYGSSRKSWGFDTVGIIQTVQPAEGAEVAPGELAFTLSFDGPEGKARMRTPDNWQEYAPCTIRLRDDEWIVEGAEPKQAKDKGRGKGLSDEHKTLLDHIKNMTAEPSAAKVSPIPGMAPVLAIPFDALGAALRLRGWLREDVSDVSAELAETSKAQRRLAKGESTRLWKRLNLLESKGFLHRTDKWVWLAKPHAEA